MASAKILTTCNMCRSRKTRCVKRNPTDETCANCRRRGDTCIFSPQRQRRTHAGQIRQAVDESRSASTPFVRTPESIHSWYEGPGDPDPSLRQASCSTLNKPSSQPAEVPARPLFADKILFDPQCQEHRQNDSPKVVIGGSRYTPSSTLAYFSEKKIATLSTLLGHSKFRDLIARLDTTIQNRLKRPETILVDSSTVATPSDHILSRAASYIKVYFEEVHPVYPFLDRSSFESIALGPQLLHVLSSDKSWAALYYAVLSIGCSHSGGDSFAPAQGEAYRYFHTSVTLIPELLLVHSTLTTAQALVAMAIFSMNHSSLSFEDVPISEAASICLKLCLGKRYICQNKKIEQSRTFWILYCLEKELTFNLTRSSAINDCDIGIPLPPPEGGALGELGWLRIWAGYCRIQSRAYERLFSVSATLNSVETYRRELDGIHNLLEQWKGSIPEHYQPGTSIRGYCLGKPVVVPIALRIHLLYYNMLAALSRLSLYVCEKDGNIEYQTQGKIMLMEAARSTLNLSHLITLEAHTPTWIMTHMPLVATFILFDFVIHNPTHSETQKNLSFLDIAAGYFSRMDLVAEGCLHTSAIAEFTHIARKHVSSQLKAVTKGMSKNAESSNNEEGQGTVAKQNVGMQEDVNQLSHGNSIDGTCGTSETLNASTAGISEDLQNPTLYLNDFWFGSGGVESLNYPIDTSLFPEGDGWFMDQDQHHFSNYLG